MSTDVRDRAAREPVWDEPDRPTARCPNCGRPFSSRERRTLHRGIAHPERLSAAEWASYETAREAEERALRRYKLAMLAGVTLAYFSFLFAYAAVA